MLLAGANRVPAMARIAVAKGLFTQFAANGTWVLLGWVGLGTERKGHG